MEDLSGAFGADKAVKDYYRYLDLENATAGVKFKSTDKTVNYSREYIASNPDGVVAMRYKADQPGKMSLRVTLAPGNPRHGCVRRRLRHFLRRTRNRFLQRPREGCAHRRHDVHHL